MPLNLREPEVEAAVRNIERRAERESDFRKLYDVYVDHGILKELSLKDNQIIYGRRGVGKSHLLSYYRDQVLSNNSPFLFQIHDATRLGSGIATQSSDPLNIAINMFGQFLNDIATQAFDSLDAIEDKSASGKAGDAILAFQGVTSKSGQNGSSFDFRNLGDTLDRYREWSHAERLVLAIDEWVAIPMVAQPYFAEFLRRTFLVKPTIIAKIAALSYQTKMSVRTDSGTIGIEAGADAFGDLDLDRFFVWEEDENGVKSFFGQALYNHLGKDLDWDLTISAQAKFDFMISSFFTQENAFVQLCRASEGNCRDFLNVFRFAYSLFLKDSAAIKIGIPHVNQASEQWYRQEKLRNIANESRIEEFLNYLVQDIIRGRKSKTFMVSYKDINHPLLARLFSARLLHPLRTVWSHPDRPGEPFHLVTMDFGCYRSLQGTRNEPDQHVFFHEEEAQTAKYDDLVPLLDRRSVRRIVLSREELDKFTR